MTDSLVTSCCSDVIRCASVPYDCLAATSLKPNRTNEVSFPIASLRVSLNGANAAAVATTVIFQWLLTYHPKFSSDIRTASSVEDGCSRRPCDKFTDHISCSSGSISSTEESCDFAIWNDPLFTKQWRVCACALDV